MNRLKENSYFAVFYGSLFLIFLWPLILLKKTFLFGDYWVQFYPWSFYYSQVIKTGHLPYWTNSVACGFPMVAEGQVGAYYAPHLIMYLFFPFFAAYTWSIPFHIATGGIGFYLYAQKLGMNKEGAALSAVLFSFSSAYGGCFYTTGTLRVLTWLPWILLSIEKLGLDSRADRQILTAWISLFIGLMFTAGFPQLAVYSILYLTCLVLLHEKRKKLFGYWLISLVLGSILALPQIYSTIELARVSVRSGESVSFAMWGSVPPPALISLIFPNWGVFAGVFFYLGIFPFFVILIQLLLNKSYTEKIHWLLAAIFILLALGKFNPVYFFVVDKLSLNGLRNPSKFLFFAVTSLSLISGFGFDKLLGSTEQKDVFLKKYLMIIIITISVIPAILSTFLAFFKNALTKAGYRYAERIFSQKKDPIHDLAYYRSIIDQMMGKAAHLLSYRSFWNLWTIAMAAFSFLIFYLSMSSKKWKGRSQWMAMVLIVMDLTLFGLFKGAGFVGNARKLENYDISLLSHGLKYAQAQAPGVFVEFDQTASHEMMPASSNLYYNIEHRGGSSPLLIKRYYELTKELGFVDASLGRHPFSKEIWSKEKGVVDALGVRWILSDVSLDLPGLQLLQIMNHHYLYQNFDALPAVYAVFNVKSIPDNQERLSYIKSTEFNPALEAVVEENLKIPLKSDLKKYKSAQIVSQTDLLTDAQIQMDKPGLVVFQNAFYPRWKALVDGKSQTLIPVDHALSGAWIGEGEHRVKFYYDLTSERWCQGVSLALWIFLAIFMIFQYRRSRFV